MSKWLDIVGVTEAGSVALPSAMVDLIREAEIVIGVPRRLEGLAELCSAQLIVWDGNLAEMVERILAFRNKPTVILASGDPNWFGIGATLSRHLDPAEFAVHPAPSSFQLAAARLGWPVQHIACISLHGRAPEGLHPHIVPGNRVLALTSDRSTLGSVADLLKARWYGQSRLTVLENLGGPHERIMSFPAHDAGEQTIGDFYVLAIDCVADTGAPLLTCVPGLPAGVFENDGQLTKREVRAATLAKLKPYPEALLWDVGAGSGSIGIEWMRAARNAKAICFERDAGRREKIMHNRMALGVPGLEVISGDAPQSFAGQASPDAVFLGGDVANTELFEACWAGLKPGGRLVANAITLDGERALIERQDRYGGDLARIEVATLDRIGKERVLRPRMAVLQWLVIKGADA